MVQGFLFAAWVEKPWVVHNVSFKFFSGWYAFVTLISSRSVEILSRGWRNMATYVQQVAVEIRFLKKDSHDVWSELICFS